MSDPTGPSRELRPSGGGPEPASHPQHGPLLRRMLGQLGPATQEAEL